MVKSNNTRLIITMVVNLFSKQTMPVRFRHEALKGVSTMSFEALIRHCHEYHSPYKKGTYNENWPLSEIERSANHLVWFEAHREYHGLPPTWAQHPGKLNAMIKTPHNHPGMEKI